MEVWEGDGMLREVVGGRAQQSRFNRLEQPPSSSGWVVSLQDATCVWDSLEHWCWYSGAAFGSQ